eukprot:CAMPEP_0184721878 /NCGR_PEP_ID=MMETSP0314-20130426/20285_1 /TAXON_ID=38298 /ORGANISM="Rhodella maculata, Strain CCMP 736" /LENGTH=116 /DNA_ID=CAMNT_0027186323 /DNA_START=54 /DNA_END=402 /DNA_ORIENTATION=+
MPLRGLELGVGEILHLVYDYGTTTHYHFSLVDDRSSMSSRLQQRVPPQAASLPSAQLPDLRDGGGRPQRNFPRPERLHPTAREVELNLFQPGRKRNRYMRLPRAARPRLRLHHLPP